MSDRTTGTAGRRKGGLGPGGSLSDVVAAAAADDLPEESTQAAAHATGPIPDSCTSALAKWHNSWAWMRTSCATGRASSG